MKKIVYNKDNLKEREINREVIRIKVIIENSDNQILLCFSSNNYHLPGGHLEDGESFDECLVREIKEETGICLPLKSRNPFLSIKYMNRNYPKEGINSKTIAYYYSINCDSKPDLNKVNLTDSEKEGNFVLKYVNRDNILKELENSLENSTIRGVVRDTIEAVKEYLKNN